MGDTDKWQTVYGIDQQSQWYYDKKSEPKVGEGAYYKPIPSAFGWR